MPKPAILVTAALLSLPPLVVATPAHASAAEAGESRARVRVVVDTKTLESPEVFEEKVGAVVRGVLEDAGYEVVESVDAEVTVRVRVWYFNAEDLDYSIDVDVSAGSELVRLETVACAGCVDPALMKKVEGHGGEIVAGIDKALAQVEGASEGVGGGGGEVKPITGLGIGGICIGAVGLGATVAGAVELSRGKIYDEPTRVDFERSYVDHRLPGGVLVGVGAVVVTAGVAMLVADLVKQSRKRSRQRAHSESVYILMRPGLAGLGYVRQF